MPISSPWGRSTEPIADGLAVAVLVVIVSLAQWIWDPNQFRRTSELFPAP